MHKKLDHVLLIIASLSVFFITLVSSLLSFSYNIGYYDKEFSKHNIYALFEEEVALNNTKNIFGFLQYKEELNMDFFNAQEKSHLDDVRKILANVFLIYYLSLFIFWGILLYYFLLRKKEMMWFFSKLMLYSGILCVSIILLLGLIYLIFGFEVLFSGFHKLFFTGNYSFDPAVSNMKALLPDEFFLDIGFSIILKTFVKGALLLVFGIYISKRR